jgi:polysaccharide pyruvyl transferase WcaK-like protein
MRAKEVGVRSEGALRIARRLAPEKHLRIVPDFALYLRPKKVCSGRKGIKRILAVNIAGVGSPVWPKRDPSLYQEYLERCVRWSCDFIERNSISQVTMLCTNHIDLNAERDFSSLILSSNADLSVVRTHPSFQVWPLFEIAGQSNIALTTRLHAGLISLLGGAAVSAFPYQPKVFDVFDGLALDNDYSTGIPLEGRGNEDSTFSYPRKISDEALQRCRHDIRICFDRVFSN